MKLEAEIALRAGGPGSGRKPGGGSKLMFNGRMLSHPLKAYHPDAQKAFKAMQALEKKPWSPAAEKQYQQHEATFRSHTEIGIHPNASAAAGFFFGTAVFPKGKIGEY